VHSGPVMCGYLLVFGVTIPLQHFNDMLVCTEWKGVRILRGVTSIATKYNLLYNHDQSDRSMDKADFTCMDNGQSVSQHDQSCTS